MKFLCLYVLLAISVVVATHAQTYTPPPCFPNYWSLNVPVQNTITSKPPLTTDMPLEVLLAYIGYDSLVVNATYDDLKQYSKHATWSDTLKYAMKYFYHMIDYDPVLYELYCMNPYPDRVELIGSFDVDHAIRDAIGCASPTPYTDRLLMRSKNIAHVRVDQIVVQTDSAAGWARTANIATCTIIDPIKGQRTLPCVSGASEALPEARANVTEVGNCIQFDYRSEAQKEPVDSEGYPWLEQDREYIVFLDLSHQCAVDNTIYYYSLTPICTGTRCSLYPIIDGVVHDAQNDLGFGTHLSVDDFKTALRDKINSIVNP